MTFSSNEARLEIALLDADAMDTDRVDVFAFFINAGVPPELVFRLEELWERTKIVFDNMIHIGRIIVLEIIRFIKANPNLAVGLAIGVAVGSLVNLVPFLGQYLAPVAKAAGAIYAGVLGFRLDRGEAPENGVAGITQDIIAISRKFFEFLASIFNALKEEFVS